MRRHSPRLRPVLLATLVLGVSAGTVTACGAPVTTGPAPLPTPTASSSQLPANLSPDCRALYNLLNQTAGLVQAQSQTRWQQFVAEARATAPSITDPTIRNAVYQLAELETQIAAFRAQPTTLPTPTVTYDPTLMEPAANAADACVKAAQH